ncbi:MAG: hypothetical protein RMN51_12985 [Verrucomicrobiota bacterium]|nr:hypothetical protein [Verrucomicrobiota bacterium]
MAELSVIEDNLTNPFHTLTITDAGVLWIDIISDNTWNLPHNTTRQFIKNCGTNTITSNLALASGKH